MINMQSDEEDIGGLPDPITLASMTKLKATGKVSVSDVAGGKIKVVTEDSYLASSVVLSYSSNGGASNELEGEAGAAAVNKYLTFKSNEKIGSSLKTLRTMEDAGVTPIFEAGRTSAKVGFTCAKDYVMDFVPALALDCKYEKWDVADAISYAKTEAMVAAANPELMLTEGLFTAAYGDASPMSNSVYYADGGASRAGVMSFREREYYGGGSAVVAATGIEDHDAFVAAVADAFEEYGSDVGGSSSGVYRGGEYRLAAPTGGANVALAFEAPSDPIVCDVLKHCLASSGVSVFASDGLIGVYGDSDAAGAATLTDSLVEALASPINSDLVAAGKISAKASALFEKEGDGSYSLATSLTMNACDSQDVAALYDECPAEAVIAAASAMVKTNLSVSALGSIDLVPYQATLSAKFV